MLVADIAVELMAIPQPALLYLVPGVLIPMIAKAFVQVNRKKEKERGGRRERERGGR